MSESPTGPVQGKLDEIMQGDEVNPALASAPWPNTTPVVDGVVPKDEVSQDPTLFDDDEDDDLEMED